ncbi:MAG: hypothetical protein HKN70_00910, partial [Gammaproteobacteria bacterium]|nr:hypothetical protein [Gammaproteobacteria bacterium]
DLVLVQPLSPRFQNAVTLRGHVAQPLRHEWRPGLRISDLLPSSEALLSPTFWLTRQSRNQVIELLNNRPDTSVGVQRSDINWEYAAIERIDPLTLRMELLPVHLGKAIIEREPAHNLELRPDDQLTIFSLNDFRTRTAQKPHFVRVEGEVQRAGIYTMNPGETLTDVISRAGGLTGDAFLYGIELQRDAVRQQQRLRINEAVDQLEQDYQRHLIERSRNVLTGEMSLAIPPEAVAIKTLITRLRAVAPTGRIVLDVNPAIRNAAELPDLVLADGDSIYVPSQPATVEVVGAVFRQGSIIYSRSPVRHYIDKAGLLATADRRNLYLIRLDGSFHRVKRGTRLNPGDTIIVPEKVDRESTVRRIKDWTQVLYQFGLGAACLALLGEL